jgi:hypothetical protein
MAEIVGLVSMAQVKKPVGKAEVVSSILTGSTIFSRRNVTLRDA